jgi:hypothetical protein
MDKFESSYNKYMKKVLIADLIKASEVPEPGDPEDAGIENIIDLSPIGVATYKHNPEHDVYVVTLTLDKGGEVREYVLTPEGLKDLIDLGTKYFYQEMEDYTFDMRVMTKDNTAGYSTGKWSDDDDIHPTITPLFGPNR